MRSSLNALLAAGIAATTVTASVAVPPPPGPKPLPIVIMRDLAIESLGVTLKPTTVVTGASQVATIEVTVKDWCKAPGTILPYVLVNMYATKGGKVLGILGQNVTIVNGQSAHISLDASALNVPGSSYIYAQVDPQNKIAEVSDGNNYQSRNPNTAPFPPAADECKVKPAAQ